MREIVFDTETTGLSPQAGERIFEIGMLELDNYLPTGRVFHHFLDPEKELSAESIRITGTTNEELVGKPKFRDIFDDLMAFIGDSPLVAHNAGFDMNFLNHELYLLGHEPLTNEVIDTLNISRKKFPGSRHSLDALCKRFEVAAHGERDYHGALLDASLLAEVYVELRGGLQGNLLGEDSTTDEGTQTLHVEHHTLARASLIIEPTAEEQAAHQAALEKLKNHTW